MKPRVPLLSRAALTAFRLPALAAAALLAAALSAAVSCENGYPRYARDLPTDAQIAAVPRAAEYNIATLGATYPVLSFGFSLLTGGIPAAYPTYYHLGRPGTLNPDALREYTGARLIPSVKMRGDADYYGGDVRVAENFMRKLYERDAGARFNLYCEDVRAQYAFRFIHAQGIPEAACRIYLLSDGAYSANASKARYGGLSEADARALLAEDRARIRVMKLGAEAGFEPEDIGNMILAFVLETPGAVWRYNGAGNLPAEVPALADVIQPLLDSGRIENQTASALFAAAREAGKLDEAKAVFNMADIAGTGGESGRKALVVMGTRTNYEMDAGSSVSQNIGGATLPALFDAVLDAYGADYDIFYKGHPATPTSDTSVPGGAEKQAYFRSRGIREIADATLPSEMLMYLIDGLCAGGYPGSTFQSAKDGQTLFFFCEPAKFKTWLTVPEPSYFLHGDTYFFYQADGAIRKTPVTAEDLQ